MLPNIQRRRQRTAQGRADQDDPATISLTDMFFPPCLPSKLHSETNSGPSRAKPWLRPAVTSLGSRRFRFPFMHSVSRRVARIDTTGHGMMPYRRQPTRRPSANACLRNAFSPPSVEPISYTSSTSDAAMSKNRRVALLRQHDHHGIARHQLFSPHARTSAAPLRCRIQPLWHRVQHEPLRD